MSEPFTVCHILCSVDGKISGDFLRAPACAEALEHYSRIRSEFGCEATVYGTATMLEGFADGEAPKDLPVGPVYGRDDFAAPSDAGHYIVSLDPNGILGWNANIIEKKGRRRAHVIEVLTEQVSDAYVSYLRSHDVSYMFAGSSSIDCATVLHKLHTDFGIERVMIAGGGFTDWSFLQAGCLDELSLVVAPLTDGATDTASVFARMPSLERAAPVAMRLKEAKPLDGSCVWLRYRM